MLQTVECTNNIDVDLYVTPKWTFPPTFILLGTFSFVGAYFFSGCVIFYLLLRIFICPCLIYVFFVQFSFVGANFFLSPLVFSLSMLRIICWLPYMERQSGLFLLHFFSWPHFYLFMHSFQLGDSVSKFLA